jgi:putative Mn2+ efflux pump MntP
LTLLFFAVALAMDVFAVSVAAGIALKCVDIRQTFRMSWHFGLFQAVMPIIGWSIGLTVRSFFQRYDHWAAFALLAFVGLHMIREAFKEDNETCAQKDPTRGMVLIILSVATSIDALTVGFSFSLLNVSIWIPAVIIEIVSILFSIVGLKVGEELGELSSVSKYAEIAGGIVIILIGLKILYEHGLF